MAKSRTTGSKKYEIKRTRQNKNIKVSNIKKRKNEKEIGMFLVDRISENKINLIEKRKLTKILRENKIYLK